MGIIPLLLFVVVDAFFGIKAAVFTVLAGIAEVSYTLYAFGEIDHFSIMTIVTIILFGDLVIFLIKASI